MGESTAADVRPERTRAERLTEGMTLALASALALVLLAAVTVVLGTTAWGLITEPGGTAVSRFVVPAVLLALVAAPFVPARLVFRSGRRRGRARLTAAVPAALTLLGSSVLPFAALCLILVHAD
ncbi:hypothetical protein ABZ023_19650 [Streptomyces sp. NPDC006367]|uniref:hypothetical protein n=1 Tax=unclassified Streptomyces TaxID=2593676 RepID=UPI0033B4D3F4